MPHIDRRALRQAIRKRDLEKLEEVLQAIAERGMADDLDLEVQEARHLCVKLTQLNIAKASLQSLNESKHVEELMNHSPPHYILFIVMKAVLVILGVPDKDLEDWAAVVAAIGKTLEDQQAFIDYVVNVDSVALQYRNIRKARQLLSNLNLNLERVTCVCPPLAPFYSWVTTFTDESLEVPSPSLPPFDYLSFSSSQSTCSTYLDSTDVSSVGSVTSRGKRR